MGGPATIPQKKRVSWPRARPVGHNSCPGMGGPEPPPRWVGTRGRRTAAGQAGPGTCTIQVYSLEITVEKRQYFL